MFVRMVTQTVAVFSECKLFNVYSSVSILPVLGRWKLSTIAFTISSSVLEHLAEDPSTFT